LGGRSGVEFVRTVGSIVWEWVGLTGICWSDINLFARRNV
jgi:hypothetical protein